jgi:hypothetical protein
MLINPDPPPQKKTQEQFIKTKGATLKDTRGKVIAPKKLLFSLFFLPMQHQGQSFNNKEGQREGFKAKSCLGTML